jgi:tRNA pseudouridine38-40 synthase
MIKGFNKIWSFIMKAAESVKPVKAVEVKPGAFRPDDPFSGKKKKLPYVVFLSYQGKNYFGMQVQKELPTIEGHLLCAMRLYGIITEEEEKKPFDFFFQRAARTDRAVSAVRQACSMKLPKDDNFVTDGAEQLNQYLPNDIRVVAIRRTTPTFHAQKSCDSRTYSYTLPTFAFAPLDSLTNSDYRITSERIEEIDELLKSYIGTHNFFNYTSKKDHEDQSCFRYILSFNCDKPFIYQDPVRNKEVEFMTIYIRGQSFMMHQIRKMIGMIIAIIRGFTYKTEVQKSFESKRMDVPRAPGIGLLLERLHYDQYDKRFSKSHASLENLGEEVESQILKIRNEMIVSEILSTECHSQSMMMWLAGLPSHTFAQSPEEVPGETSSSELSLLHASFANEEGVRHSGKIEDTTEEDEEQTPDELATLQSSSQGKA